MHKNETIQTCRRGLFIIYLFSLPKEGLSLYVCSNRHPCFSLCFQLVIEIFQGAVFRTWSVEVSWNLYQISRPNSHIQLQLFCQLMHCYITLFRIFSVLVSLFLLAWKMDESRSTAVLVCVFTSLPFSHNLVFFMAVHQ